jgi:hypothetical protein
MNRRFIYLAKLGIVESTNELGENEIQKIDLTKEFQSSYGLSFEPLPLKDDAEALELFNSISDDMLENLKIEGIEGTIIDKAREIMKNDFMQYPDYDPSIPTYLCDALTILISQHLEEESTNEIYDFLETKINE